MTIQYKGRELDVARLQCILKQSPIIKVEPSSLNFLGLNTESSELLVHPNEGRYDVLAGQLPDPETLSKKQKAQTEIPVRLASKQLLKKWEDLSVNGSEVAPPPEPYYAPRSYPPRSDNYDRPQQRFDRFAERDQRPAPVNTQPRQNGGTYQPRPSGPPYAPAPSQRPSQPLPGSLQQSMQKLSAGLRLHADVQPAQAQARPQPLESANSHRPISGQYIKRS